MAGNCVNKNSKEFLDLQNELNMNPFTLAADISLWQEINGLDKFPTVDDILKPQQVNSSLKAVEILSSDKAKQVFSKGQKNSWSLDKILTELQIPKDQKQLLLDLNINNREELALELASNLNFPIEIETTMAKESFSINKKLSTLTLKEFKNLPVESTIIDSDNEYLDIKFETKKYNGNIYEVQIVEGDYNNNIYELPADKGTPTRHYSQLTVPGGTNYIENEIATPTIKPSIKGHAEFATDKGIGWFRSDDRLTPNKQEIVGDFINEEGVKEYIYAEGFKQTVDTNTRRILEVQSDLFQKGRDRKSLVDFETDGIEYHQEDGEYFKRKVGESWEDSSKEEFENALTNSNKNNFLQLLNKDNNWVNFFIKSIIQDSVKKGYEKVLFPSGNTASKVEGHSTLEEFKKQKEQEIENKESEIKLISSKQNISEQEQNIIAALEKGVIQSKEEFERLEKEGFGALKPIYNFYENVVSNILRKQGYKPVEITDEFGNTWNEVTLDKIRDSATIFMKQIDFNDLIDPNETSFFNEAFVEQEIIIDNKSNNLDILLGTRKEANTFTVDEVLNNILNNSDSIELTLEVKDFINQSKKLMKKSKASIRIIPESEMADGLTIMQYESDNNEIQISKDRLLKYNTREGVVAFLHEVVHSVTVHSMLKDAKDRTFAEQQLVDVVNAFMKKYGDSKLAEEYGFSNEFEFVAEFYANPAFRQAVKEESDSWWNKILDAIRRVFGSPKNPEYDKLYNTIVDFVENTREDFTGIKHYDRVFAKQVEVNKPSFRTLEDRLTELTDSAKDKIQQAYYKTRASKRGKSKEERKEHLKDIKNLLDTMTELAEVDKWKSIVAYTEKFRDTVFTLKSGLDKHLKTKDEFDPSFITIIDAYENYLSSFDLLDDIENVIYNTSEINKLPETAQEDVQKIKDLLKTFTNERAELLVNFSNIRKAQSIAFLSNPKYNTEVETKWKNKLTVEYNQLGKTKESKNEYISRMLTTDYKDEYEADLKESSEKLANDPDFDITKYALDWSDPLNINSKLIQIAMNMLGEMRENITSTFKTKDLQLNKIYKNFIKTKSSSKPSVIYQDFYEQDSKGNYFLKGKYSIKFREAYINELAPVDNALNALIKENLELGLEFNEIKQLEEYKDLNTKRGKWIKEHTVIDKTKGRFHRVPHSKYLNKNLSKDDQKVMDEFVSITKDTHTTTGGKSSLIKTIKLANVEFYKLPSITKSDLERTLEGDVKGIYKDKLSDLTEIKTDDIGYSGEAVNSKNEAIQHVKVHFRGKIKPENQSLDLFTLYRKEYLNGLNYSEKSKGELELNLLANIVKDKQYYKISDKTGTVLVNMFNKNNKPVLTSGEYSNTYKKFKGLLERNIYDTMRHNGGKLGAVDVNKLSDKINGAAATVALSFNVASGMANVTNGFTQLFIESVGGGVFNKSSLLKAEAKYTKDLPNILADLSSPVKTSFTNQVLEMFDSIGGFDPATQEYLRNNIVKKLASFKTLNTLNETGEHAMSSIITMATLDSLKVMNDNNKFIDKNGNIVEESKAASLLDMLKMNENGQLIMDEKVAYTKHNLTTKYHEGGKVHINLLIKKKSFDIFGVYDDNFANEMSKNFIGKSLMMFKKFFISGLQYRYHGISKSLKSKEDLADEHLFYNTAEKQYIEGTYTTLARFLFQDGRRNLQSLLLLYQRYNELTDYEKSNLKKATFEVMLTAVLLPTLGMLLAAGDDDDELVFWMYQVRRLESELSQFRNPIEASRMIQNPVAGIRIVQDALKFSYEVLTPLNFVPEDNENVLSYLDEDREGKNILLKRTKKVVPIFAQFDKDWKQLYNLINK